MLPTKVTKGHKDQRLATSQTRHQSARQSNPAQVSGAAVPSGTCDLGTNPAALPLPSRHTSVASLSMQSILQPASGQGTKARAPARAEAAKGRASCGLLHQSNAPQRRVPAFQGKGTMSWLLCRTFEWGCCNRAHLNAERAALPARSGHAVFQTPQSCEPHRAVLWALHW